MNGTGPDFPRSGLVAPEVHPSELFAVVSEHVFLGDGHCGQTLALLLWMFCSAKSQQKHCPN